MKIPKRLVMTDTTHNELSVHLFPGDGLEAVAVLICSHAGAQNERLCVRQVLLIPPEHCSLRTKDRVSWPGEWIEAAIDKAEKQHGAIILMHSHPSGTYCFSAIDDASDQITMRALSEAFANQSVHHGSAIMTPDGLILARLYDQDQNITADLIPCVIGQEFEELTPQGQKYILPFSAEMRRRLSSQTACVVGVSGTGSIVAEQVLRLGFGRVIFIEFDKMEAKNINRILNSTEEDARLGAAKVMIAERAAKQHRPDAIVEVYDSALASCPALTAASGADVIFCCVDSIEGRHHCDLLAQACLIPIVDIGVTIPTRRDPAKGTRIGDVCGRIDFIAPGASSLFDRGVVTPDGLQREYLQSVDPIALKDLEADSYIKGAQEEAPSVISLNMRAASAGVNEWLARNFNIREENNALYSRTLFSLAGCEEDYYAEADFPCSIKPTLGAGLGAVMQQLGVQ